MGSSPSPGSAGRGGSELMGEGIGGRVICDLLDKSGRRRCSWGVNWITLIVEAGFTVLEDIGNMGQPTPRSAWMPTEAKMANQVGCNSVVRRLFKGEAFSIIVTL